MLESSTPKGWMCVGSSRLDSSDLWASDVVLVGGSVACNDYHRVWVVLYHCCRMVGLGPAPNKDFPPVPVGFSIMKLFSLALALVSFGVYLSDDFRGFQ